MSNVNYSLSFELFNADRFNESVVDEVKKSAEDLGLNYDIDLKFENNNYLNSCGSCESFFCFDGFSSELEEILQDISKENKDLSFLCVLTGDYVDEPDWDEYMDDEEYADADEGYTNGIKKELTNVYYKEENDADLLVQSFDYKLNFNDIKRDIKSGVFLDIVHDYNEKRKVKTVVWGFEPYLVNLEDCKKYILKRFDYFTPEEVDKMTREEINEWVGEADAFLFLDLYESERISEEEAEEYLTEDDDIIEAMDFEDIDDEEFMDSIVFEIAGTMYRDVNAVREAIYQNAKVFLISEPTNLYDKNAIRIESEHGVHLGYVPSYMVCEFDEPSVFNCKIKFIEEGEKAPFITVEAIKEQ